VSLLTDHREILRELDEIEDGKTDWQQDVTRRLVEIKDQLDRIEEVVSGGQTGDAVTLGAVLGQPQEQP